MLSKLVALDKFGGRGDWTTSLPVVVKNINESCAYGSPLSRSALHFSPFHHSNPALVLNDPFLLQKNNLDMLNLKRIEKLQNKGVSKKIFKFKVGNYVLLRGNTKTEGGSKSNVSPKYRDVYKVTELMNNGFGLRILN